MGGAAGEQSIEKTAAAAESMSIFGKSQTGNENQIDGVGQMKVGCIARTLRNRHPRNFSGFAVQLQRRDYRFARQRREEDHTLRFLPLVVFKHALANLLGE